LAPLAERYLASDDDMVLLGLSDLLLTHEAHTSLLTAIAAVLVVALRLIAVGA
jgi:hypothetical protein